MDKSWAAGLTQQEFMHEFKRRNPSADTIPDAKEWVGANAVEHVPMKLPSAEEINPNLDGRDMPAILRENEAVKAEENGGKTDHLNKVYDCICGKTIKSRLGLWNHQQKCEQHLNSKVA